MPPPVVMIGLDPAKYRNGHVSYVIAHALAAQRAGFQPQLFCYGSRSETQETEFGTIHRVSTPLRHFMLAPANSGPMAASIVEYLSGCQHPPPHIVHGFGTWAGAAVAATRESSQRGVAAVAVVSAYTAVADEWRGLLRAPRPGHGVRAPLFHAAWYPWAATALAHVERRGCQGADAVLVNYESVARLLRQAYGTGLELRRVPYAAVTAFNPPSTQVVAPTPATIVDLEPKDAPLIVSIARHSPNKGIDVLLHALAGLTERGVGFRACLVGPGRLLSVHRRLASRLGLDGRVALAGEVDDVVPYLQRADVFVLASLKEGSGSVALLEALQAGAPAVVSACDGIPEDVTDGVDALLVPPGDAEALRNALGAVLTDPALRAELATRGRELFLQRFSAEALVDALRDVYARLGAPVGRPAVQS